MSGFTAGRKSPQKKRSRFYQSVALLTGTIIGAGVLGIPYVVAQAGFLIGMLNVLVLGIVVLVINLYVGEIALRTKKDHMLAGYAEKYLGKWGKTAMALTTLFGIYGALLAYTIGEGRALAAIFGGDVFTWSLIFFAIFAGLMLFKLNVVADSELILSAVVIVLILVISFMAFGHIDYENLKNIDLSNVFLPYGVIFFAFVGASAIPTMEAELGSNDKKKLKKAIIIGSLIPLVLYSLFAFVVVGVTGLGTTEVATIGLGNILGAKMLLFGNLFAIFSMATSFLLLGFAMKWMFHYDYGLSRFTSWLITCSVPLILFLAGISSFIEVIGITGAVMGGAEGILIVLTALAAKRRTERKPEYSLPLNWLGAGFFILVFALGIAYQFLY